MANRFTRITLRADELAPYRAAVIACSYGEDSEACERLLGQLASLEALARCVEPETPFTFAPPPGGARLARAAVEHLHKQPLRRRFVREPATWTQRRRTPR
jgi:hypothetical protein